MFKCYTLLIERSLIAWSMSNPCQGPVGPRWAPCWPMNFAIWGVDGDRVVCSVYLKIISLLSFVFAMNVNELKHRGSMDTNFNLHTKSLMKNHCSIPDERLNIKMSYQYNQGIPIVKTRLSHDRLIFIIGIPIPGKTVFKLRRDPA